MNKHFLLRSLNRFGWSYAYLGLIYALYFIYFIVVPSYQRENRLSSLNYRIFNIIFLYFFSQGYFNLIRTTFSRIYFSNKENLTNQICHICNHHQYIVERSHHCYICKKCIPIQDHHCFFVGTCIGEHNRKYFIFMLFHLLIAHIIGYLFVSNFLWNEIGGLHLLTIPKILFFNIGYLIGFVETKWQAFICLHHYLVYFDMIFISRLFYQILKRSLNGQTQYEETKGIRREKQSLTQIFGENKWNWIFPFSST